MTKSFLRNLGVAAAIALLALTLVPRQGLAQLTSGDLTGLITDATGAAVPNATVDATNIATGVKYTQPSNGTGEYRFSNLPIGSYDISATAKGFGTTNVKAIPISLNRITNQNLTLQVGAAVSTVEVTEAVQSIDTSSAQITNSFDTKMTADLPNSSTGSGVLNLSLLSAGVATSGGVGVGSGPSVGGQRPRNNNFTVEGVDNNSKSVTGPLVFVPNDSVQEFTVLQNQFQAEYGHSSGGQFNTAIRSGTNEFHGVAYDYLQNRNLNAIDQLFQNQGVTKNPRYDQNRLGFGIGGPIKKNKLFFFANYEYNPIGRVGTSGGVTAPTAAGLSTLAALPGISSTNLKIVQQYLPTAATNDQGTDDFTIGGKAYHIPIGTVNINAPNYQNNHYIVSSVDYNLSDKDQLRGRFIMNKSDGVDNAAQFPAFFLTLPTRNYLATLSEYHNFTPSITNEFRFGYNRYNNTTPAGNFQFAGLDSFPNITFDELGVQLGPDGNAPQFTIQNLYQFNDNVTWIKGRHTFKFGFDGRKQISPQSFTQRGRGDYEYSSIAGFLLDLLPDDLAQRTTGAYVYYGDQIATYGFASDTWKATRNLTVDLGVRYEYTTIPYGERQQKVNSLASVPGLISFNEPKPQKTAWAPRIGLAYSPGTDGNTSIRAGFGMAYDVLFDNLGILSSPPQFQQTVDLTCGQADPFTCTKGFLANGGIKPNASAGTLSAADAKALTGGYVPDQKLPYSISWNLGVQHVFAKDYTIEVRYVGTRGIHLPAQIRLNQQAIVQQGNSLPLYLSNPGQATLDSLKITQSQLVSQYSATATSTDAGGILPAYYKAGFQSPIVGFMPWGNSSYNGLSVQMDRRFSNGLQFRSAYTWSHGIDDTTAEVFSTILSPRRVQDFGNLSAEKASSALDHRQRFTTALYYDLPFFKKSNTIVKNVVGNWLIAPIYTYQSPEYYTVQSGVDSNLNGDSAPDRSIVNPNGIVGTSSTSTALKNSAGQIVAYVATNPNAQYIQAGKGVLPNASRNTLAGRPIDNVDLSLIKRISITERFKFEFQAQMLNAFNHAQFIAGSLNDVAPVSYTSSAVRNLLITGAANFNKPEAVLSSNPRSIQLTAKFRF